MLKQLAFAHFAKLKLFNNYSTTIAAETNNSINTIIKSVINNAVYGSDADNNSVDISPNNNDTNNSHIIMNENNISNEINNSNSDKSIDN